MEGTRDCDTIVDTYKVIGKCKGMTRYNCIFTDINASIPRLWYLVGGEEACMSQGLWELYRRGLKPLAGLTKPGRYQGRDQRKPST